MSLTFLYNKVASLLSFSQCRQKRKTQINIKKIYKNQRKISKKIVIFSKYCNFATEIDKTTTKYHKTTF